ncbi:unnamed protein product [Trypanosoma congolense IL3000]|uniref:WGS project CAEQ00000000 data, annotated contig 800 n=1 Tax=Trypanosoma congolense (strain IL3000) TaxID=1068625 RepID=F9WII8_TRYCI|nr:unnamed protein product [Trypanosoma congolense IL3000]
MKARVEELERRCMEAGVLLDGCNEGLRVREDMILRLRKSLTQQLLQVTQLRQTRSSWDAWRRFTEARHHKRNLAMHRYDSHQRELVGAEVTYRQCLMRLEASSRKALAAKRSCSYAEVLSRQAVAELSDMADLYASLQKEMAQLKSDSAGLLKKQREQASALHFSRVECVERAEIVERMRLCNGELRSRRELDQIMTEYRAAMTRQKCAALQLRVNNTNDKLQTVGALAAEYCARHAYTRWLLIAERKKHTRQLKITQLPSRPSAASEHKSNQWPQVPITRSDASVQFSGMQPERLNEATQFSGMQPERLNEATQFSGMQPTRLNEATQFSGIQPTRLNEATQFSGMQPTRLNEATQFSGMQPTRLNEATQFSGMQPERLNEATQFSGMQPERLNEATQFSGMQPTRLNEATQFSGIQPTRLNEATQFSGMQPTRLNEATQFSGMQPTRLNEATQFSGMQPERLNEATQFSGMQPERLNEATQFSGMQPERLNEATQFSGMQPERLNEATQFSGMQPERLNEATQFSGMQPTRLNEATQFSGMQPTRLNEATQFSGMQPTRLNEATQFSGIQPTRLNEATQFSGMQPERLNEATQFSGMQPERLNEATQFSGMQPTRLNEATQFSGIQPTRLNEATQFSGMQPTRLNEATQFSGIQPTRLNEATQFSGMQPTRLNEATQFSAEPKAGGGDTHFVSLRSVSCGHVTEDLHRHKSEHGTQCHGQENITSLVSQASDGAVGVSLVSTACQVGTTQVACALEDRHHASGVSTTTVVSSAAPLLEYAMHLAFTGQDALAEHSRAVVDAAWEAAASMLHDRQHAHEVALDELLRYQSFLEDRLVAAEATSGDIRESDQTAARVRQLQEQLENSEAVTRALRLGLERLQLQREQEEKEQKRIESKLAETEGHRSRYEREVEALQRRVGEQWVHTEEVKDKLNVARQRIESLETALKEERHDHEKQLSDLQSRIDGQRLHDENVQRKVLEAQRHIESLLATLDEERSRHKVEIMTLEEQVEDQKLQEEKTQRAAAITNANQSREICELKTEVRRLNVQLKEAQKANDFHRALYDAARQYENALAALEKDVATRAGAFAASLETLADLDKFSSTLAEHYKNDMERLLELADTVQQRWREEHQPPPQEGNDRQHIDPPQTTTNNKHDHRTLEANTLKDTIEGEPLDAGALQQQLLEAQERLASLESQLKQSNDMHQEVVSDLKQQLEESRRREEKTRKEALNARATYDRDMCVLRAEGKRLSSQVEELVATTEATRRQSEAAELETRKQLEEARSQVKGLKTELKTLTMQRALECDGFDSAVRGLKENIKKLKSELDIARERSFPGGATVRHLLRRAEGVTAMAYAHINEKISLYLDCCTQWSEGQCPKSEKLLSNSIAELRSCMDLLLEKISQTSAQCEKERLNNEQQMKALQRLLEQQKQQPQQVEGSQHPPGCTRHAASGATGEGGADAPWLCCRCEAPLRGKLPNVAVAQSITRYSDILQDQHHKNTERLEQLNLLVAQVDELMTYGRSLPMFDRILSGKE